MTKTDSPVERDAPSAVKPVLAAAREQISRLRGGALLIGVEQYPNLTDKDLPAGRNDVLAFWKVCRRLGYTQIRALSSPALTEDDLVRAELELAPELSPGETREEVEARVRRWLSRKEPAPTPEFTGETAAEVAERVQEWLSSMRREPGDLEVILGEATSDEMKRGAAWLARGLVTNVKLTWGAWEIDEDWMALPGLMTYSGHGAQRDGDLVLCPADTGRALEDAVSFSELHALFNPALDRPGRKRPSDNLTIVLDCCFAAATGPTGNAQRVPTLTAAGPSRGATPLATKEIGSRVFCASGRDEPSYQAMLGGHWHGAFTWALTVALEQWKIQQDGQFKRSTMSHAELLFRARMLLQALSFRQHPILVDELGNLPVFHHGASDGDATSPVPDAERPGGQIDPTGDRDYAYYRILANGELLLEIIAARTGSPQGGFMKGKEYWKIRDGLAQIDTNQASSIKVVKRGRMWSDGNNPPPFAAAAASFICSLDATWTTRSNASDYRAYADESGRYQGFRLNARRSKDGTWAGTIEWFRPASQTHPMFFSNNTDKEFTLAARRDAVGMTFVNYLGTHWTGPLTGYGDGDWKADVLLPGEAPAAAVQVRYQDSPYGIINARLFAGSTPTAWASDDMDGSSFPSDANASQGAPVTGVRIYADGNKGLVNLDHGTGWLTAWKSGTVIAAPIPAGCVVVGVRGKKRAGYGLVDIDFAYRQLSRG
ncbi:caspase family protein [Sorangium sp. So ce233]|uniref:caspase family protein n=1 Tax=Sorangium sp. So ce233 TaxID=3133290 RepID=UPI003F610B2F